MSVADQHRAVATDILIQRSRGGWGLDEDRAAVVQERLLWAQMTESDQAVDNAWLVGVWGSRGADRLLVGADGVSVKILDSAFGLAVDGYRPWAKGPVEDLGVVGKWLWLRGYQVIRWGGDSVTMVIPSHRVVHESDRLIAALIKAGVSANSIGPWDGAKGAIQLRASYDPVQGVATMELIGLGELVALGHGF